MVGGGCGRGLQAHLVFALAVLLVAAVAAAVLGIMPVSVCVVDFRAAADALKSVSIDGVGGEL